MLRSLCRQRTGFRSVAGGTRARRASSRSSSSSLSSCADAYITHDAPPSCSCSASSSTIRRMSSPCRRSSSSSRAFSTSSSSSSSSSTSAVSDAEVQKFTALSDSWWDPKQNPLIHMNVIRMRYIQEQVRQHLVVDRNDGSSSNKQQQQQLPLHGLKALDVGCGGGLLSESLARLGATVDGIDPSPALIAAARAHATAHLSTLPLNRLTYTAGVTVEELLAKQQQQQQSPSSSLFDLVCCLEVIEHAPNPSSLLRAAGALLKPGGLLFVSTVNRTAKSFVLTIVGAEYVMRYLPVGTHDWNSYKSPGEVEQLLLPSSGGDLQLQTLDVSGMVLAPESLPAVVTRNEWNWQLDPTDTDVNWIGCYQRKKV